MVGPYVAILLLQTSPSIPLEPGNTGPHAL